MLTALSNQEKGLLCPKLSFESFQIFPLNSCWCESFVTHKTCKATHSSGTLWKSIKIISIVNIQKSIRYHSNNYNSQHSVNFSLRFVLGKLISAFKDHFTVWLFKRSNSTTIYLHYNTDTLVKQLLTASSIYPVTLLYKFSWALAVCENTLSSGSPCSQHCGALKIRVSIWLRIRHVFFSHFWTNNHQEYTLGVWSRAKHLLGSRGTSGLLPSHPEVLWAVPEPLSSFQGPWELRETPAPEATDTSGSHLRGRLVGHRCFVPQAPLHPLPCATQRSRISPHTTSGVILN